MLILMHISIGISGKHPRIQILNAAKAKQLAEGMTLKMVRKLNKQDYNDMDIPKGIRMRLTDEVKVYKKGRE